MNENSLIYDVVIVGAGVAGCATAIALKNEVPNLRIAILERKADFKSNCISTHRIGETLPPHASQQLQKLGIWNSFLKCKFDTSYGTSAAWGSSELYHNEYIYSPFGYGWHLDRVAFDQFMMKEAQKKGVLLYFESSIISSEKKCGSWFLEIISPQNNQSIKSGFVIDATGKKAAFSNLQKSVKIKEDQMVAVYQFYNSKDCHKDRSGIGSGTCVETDPFGWWYSAALPNRTIVVAYMTDADIANQLKLGKKETFNYLLNHSKYTQSRIKNTTTLSDPQITAAHTQYLSAVTGDSWLAVGDAASSYDPISSLGIFKSLAISQFAAYATLDYLKGNKTGLQKYQHIITQDYRAYMKKRQEYYTQEDRYTTSLFWKRRHTTKTITN
ncbi:tryptophan 7-halogenase [Aquimarina sp. SS2-1]|uniref:tryptophan 7-halogenase n=1 Tax=Aquimarina besae TaxID=3342247 RepID=UPI00366F9CE2